MNLQELKTMIAEEYNRYLAEQPTGPIPAPPGMEPPAIAVSDADVDVTGGGENAEATLREIYEMLKAYFEGGEAEAEVEDDMGDDMEDADVDDAEGTEDEDEDEDEGEALQERFKKLANIIKG